MDDYYKRFDVFFEKHIGIGLRWRSGVYKLELSLSLPFITITYGFGGLVYDKENY